MANITLRSNPVTTFGELPKIGTTLPSFVLVGQDLLEKTLNDYEGKRKVLNIFPSIDTGICAMSTRKFNEVAGSLENTVVINISKDLPFALKRFCGAENIQNAEALSDFRGTLGTDYGVLMIDSPMKGLLSRAVIVTDENNQVIYTEQVSEITHEPDYDKALNVLKA